MNFKRLAEEAGLEEDEFLELAQDFVEIGNSDLAALHGAIDKGDARQVFEAAHSIKGAAVNFGFEEIARVAREVEINARNGVLDGSREAAQILLEKFSGITAALQVRTALRQKVVE
jgi:HPt (histidine-containing phosphotransfer) domain-containing protein